MTARITKEGLEAKLAASLDMLEGVISAEDNPAKLAHVLGRYADTLVRAIATLYPTKQQLELTRGDQTEWEKLSPAERLVRIAHAKERLDVMEIETKMLSAKEEDP